MWTVYDHHGRKRTDLTQSEAIAFLRTAFAGKRRAAFWRALGWPNLKKATEGRARYCRELRERRAREAEEKRQQLDAYLESTRDDL